MNKKSSIFIGKKIIDKLGYPSLNEWTKYDYLILREKIKSETGKDIHEKTLERLLNYNKSDTYSPIDETKNAISHFLGYTNWDELKKYANITSNKNTKRKRIFILTFIVMFLCLTAAILLMNREKIPEISIDYPSGKAPHRFTINHNIDSETSPWSINFEDGFIIDLNRNNQKLEHGYLFPFLYELKLLKNGEKTGIIYRVSVTNERWESRIAYKKHNPSKISLPYKDSLFYYSREELLENGLFENEDFYYLNHRIYKDFSEFDSDNILFSAMIKSKLPDSLSQCSSIEFVVSCTNSRIRFEIGDTNCTDEPHFIINNKDNLEISLDKSLLTDDIKSWSKVEFKTNNNNAELFLNGRLLFSTSYNTKLGTIKGFVIMADKYSLVRDVKINNIEIK
jgi:hypothetical protein